MKQKKDPNCSRFELAILAPHHNRQHLNCTLTYRLGGKEEETTPEDGEHTRPFLVAGGALLVTGGIMASISPRGAVEASKEAQVILAPPSPTNPVPILPAALRLDNNEQLMTLLQTNPTGSSDMPFRQLLVFSDDSLRTLLLRQVMTDPNTRVFKGKKNWDPGNIIGTRIMPHSSGGSVPKVRTDATMEGAEVSLLQDESWDNNESVDVITYFLRASALSRTTQLLDKIRSWNLTTHHRVVYLPQPTAIVQKMWSGLLSTASVTIHKFQLDIFPLEPDVLSLEYTDAMKETEVDGIPSTLITTVARSLLKIQDVVGTIPRVQALGPMGEEVVRKMFSLRLEEYLSSSSELGDVSSEAAEVDAMLIMDRKVDLVTPMVTPLTYEGLLDDILGIDGGYVRCFGINTFCNLD
jgi:Sec1 family